MSAEKKPLTEEDKLRILKEFAAKIVDQQPCPPEFLEILNKNPEKCFA